jgi:hypothetical protein
VACPNFTEPDVKILMISGALLAAGLGMAAPAAATAPPTMDKSTFACSNGVCEVGPRNVGRAARGVTSGLEAVEIRRLVQTPPCCWSRKAPP